MKRRRVNTAVYVGLAVLFGLSVGVLFATDCPWWVFVVLFALYWGLMAVLRLRQPHRSFTGVA